MQPAWLILRRCDAPFPCSPQDRRTPIFHAVLAGHTAVLEALLGAGADAHKGIGRSRTTPLHLAMRRGHEGCLPPLLGAGASPGATDARGRTPLHEAASAGQTAALAALAAAVPPADMAAAVAVADGDGNTALHAACKRGRLDVVQRLLDMGADSSARDLQWHTPVHVLASAGDAALPSLQAVLAAGGDAGAAMRNGVTPLHEAAKANAPGIAEALLAAGAPASPPRQDTAQTPLHTAAFFGAGAVASALLKGGAEANAMDAEHRTPLHIAIERQHSSVMHVLLEHPDTDVGMTTKEGTNAVDLALQRAAGLDPAAVAKCARKLKIARKRRATMRGTGAAVVAVGPTFTGADKVQDSGTSQASPPPRSPDDDPDAADCACPRSCSEASALGRRVLCSTALDIDLYGLQACLPERHHRNFAVLVGLQQGVQHFVAFVASVQLLVEYAAAGTDSFNFIAAVIVFALVVLTDVGTTISISRLAYDGAEIVLRVVLAATGFFPLALALGMQALGKDESRLFQQFLAVEGFGAALPQLLLVAAFIAGQAAGAGGALPSSTALWLSLAVNVLAAASEIVGTRLDDVSSQSVPGMLEELFHRAGKAQGVLYSALYLMTTIEVLAAVLLYGVLITVYPLAAALVLLGQVVLVLAFAAWRLQVHKEVREASAYAEGVSVPVALLYYAVMCMFSGAGIVHGYGTARSDAARMQLLSLNNTAVGTARHDAVFASAVFRAVLFLLCTSSVCAALLLRCPSGQALCILPSWRAAILASTVLLWVIQIAFITCVFVQRRLLCAEGPQCHTTCTALREQGTKRRKRLGLGNASRLVRIRHSESLATPKDISTDIDDSVTSPSPGGSA